MIKKEQRLLLAYLTGHIPVDLRGETLPEDPTDDEIRNLLLQLPASVINKINAGSGGERFKTLTHEAVDRIRETERAKRPAPRYRVAARFLDFEPHEVSQSGKTIGPAKRNSKKS